MNQLELSKSIAVKAHKGQLRRNGVEYITHPRRVALSMPNDFLASVAWLHDVVEDTDETRDSLLDKGVSKEIVDAVMQLTKVKNENYIDYIEEIAIYGGIAKVKIADMFDNLCDSPTDRQQEKYRKAIGILLLSI